MKYKIQYLSPDKLTPNPDNPRLIKDAAFKKLVKSLEDCPELFDARPCLVSNRTGENIILGGNMRYRSALELGWDKVPVIIMEGLTESQEKEIAIKDNGDFGEWDFDILANKWSDLPLTEWGVDVPALFADTDEVREDDFDAEEEAEKIEVAETEPGDIWILGRHRLICGDATSKDDIKKLMVGEMADMVITDPPYNVDYGERKILNDNMDKRKFKGFILEAFKNLYSVIKKGGVAYIFHAEALGMDVIFRSAFEEAGFKPSEILVWVKNSAPMGRQDYNWRHEPIIYGWKQGAAHFFNHDFSQTTVIDDEANIMKMTKAELVAKVIELQKIIPETVFREKRPVKSDLHPTMKPIALVARMIRNSTNPSKQESVLDPFGGSGTTLMAAEQTGRVAYLCELDPIYCDVIKIRWEQFTGGRGELYHHG